MTPATKSGTPYADARRDILNVLGKFDALLVLRDSLEAAADAESVLAKHKADVASAQDTLATLNKAIAAAEQTMSAARGRIAETDARVSNDLAERRKKHQAEISRAAQERDNAISALQAEAAQGRAEYAVLQERYRTEVQAQRAELSQLEARVADAHKALADAKARVGGL